MVLQEQLRAERLVKPSRAGGLDLTLEGRFADLVAVLFLILVSVIALSPGLILGKRLVDGDIYRQSVPVLAAFAEALRGGQSPLWSTAIFGGFPIAFSQYSLLSPIDSGAALLMSPDRAFSALLAFHLPLAGIAAYYFARVIGVSRLSSVLAAVCYQMSTETLGLGINGYALRTHFLLPALLLSAELVWRRSWRWALLASLATGFALLSGTAFIVVIASTNAAIYVLIRAALLFRKGARVEPVRLMVSFGVAVLLGAGLAAMRVLPSAAVVAESVRAAGIPGDSAAEYAPSIGLLAAGYLLPLTRIFDIVEVDWPSYVGPVVLSFALLGMTRVRRDSTAAIFSFLVLFNTLVALGQNTPFFNLLGRVPPFGYFNNPARFTMASALFLALLAAQTMDWLTTDFDRSPRVGALLKKVAIVVSLIVCAALLIGLLWVVGGGSGISIAEWADAHRIAALNPSRPRMLLALFSTLAAGWILWLFYARRVSPTILKLSSVGITTALLLGIALVMIPYKDPRTAPPATAGFIQGDRGNYKVLALNPGIAFYNTILYASGNDPSRVNPYRRAELDFELRLYEEMLVPNLGLPYGISHLDGYEVLQSPRQAIAAQYAGSDNVKLSFFDQPLHGAFGEDSLGAKLRAVHLRKSYEDISEYIPVLRAFGVKYVLTNTELRTPPDKVTLAFSSQIPILQPDSKTTVYVYRVENVLPGSYLVPQCRQVDGPIAALDDIRAERANPSREVLLEEQCPIPSSLPALDPSSSGVDRVTDRGSDVQMELHTSGAGYLVVNRAYYSGWRAEVDGREVPIRVSDGWIQSVAIDREGRHTVHLWFEAPLYREGTVLTVLSALVVAVVLAWTALQRATFLRRRSRPAEERR